MLNALNEKEQLVPASYMMPLNKFKKLDPESCSGVRLPQGLRLAAGSSGHDYGLRGFTRAPDGKERNSVFIGSFYSEFPFLLHSRTFPAGPYMVMAFADALELSGDDPSGTHYDMNRRQQVPNSRVEEIPLRSPIPAELLAKEAPAVPRFVISVDGRAVLLTVLNNKLSITPK